MYLTKEDITEDELLEIKKQRKIKEEESLKKLNKKSNYSKIIVTAVIVLNVVFTIGIMLLFLKKGTEPTTLITAFFSFTTIELWQLSKIKRSKIDKE